MEESACIRHTCVRHTSGLRSHFASCQTEHKSSQHALHQTTEFIQVLDMSFTYKAKCRSCPRSFPTTASLKKHRLTKHKNPRPLKWPSFEDDEGHVKQIPRPRKMHQKMRAAYFVWLAMVVERFNNVLHPRARGKTKSILGSLVSVLQEDK